MNKSAREKEKKYNDKDAFIQEAQRIERDGGVENANNYNKINSPGKKYLDRLK